jgi:hypothetical protein
VEQIQHRVLGHGKPLFIRKETFNVAPPLFLRSGSFLPVIASTSKSILFPYPYVSFFIHNSFPRFFYEEN